MGHLTTASFMPELCDTDISPKLVIGVTSVVHIMPSKKAQEMQRVTSHWSSSGALVGKHVGLT